MSKKSKKNDSKKKSKNSERDDSAAKIAKAEKRLRKTLRKLDEVRAELAEREATLRDLLVQYGRMPEEPAAGGEPGESQDESDDAVGAVADDAAGEPADGPLEAIEQEVEINVVRVPLLDQHQVYVFETHETIEHIERLSERKDDV